MRPKVRRLNELDVRSADGEARGARWCRYYDAVEGRPAHQTLLQALAIWGHRRPGFAVDLGCGNGRDTLALADAGWRVLAIDSNPAGISRLDARLTPTLRERIETRVAEMETVDLPACDLLNAGFSLPFCRPEAFPSLWNRVCTSLRAGGLFAGHLLGPDDSWAADGVVVHTRAQAMALFDGFELCRYREEIEDGQTAVGRGKRWHIHHCVARRKPLTAAAK